MTDVVESDISLLLSEDSIKAAKVELDLENDSATIFGHEVDLQCISSGHYCVPLHQHELPVESCLQVQSNHTYERKVQLALVEKLHKQFAHRISQRLKSLMKDAGIN